MMKKSILPAFLFLFAVIATAVPGAARADGDKEQAAVELIKNLGNEAVKTLADTSLNEKQKAQKFEELLDKGFDMRLVGQFVLGRYWREASDSQKTEFQKVFRDYMVSSYSDKIGSYSGEDLKIKEAKSLNDRESLVYALIERPNGPPIKLDWRVRKTKSGEEKVIDVIVEGISMAQTQRSEFASVIGQPGVGIDGLIKKLKEQTMKGEG
ncbi:MAG: ABC transporter substrate-binding protein [Alphaproteobacteria bacterium]|nr:MAG: ABC transporter substrate-binding protein [Alphaproteobacteria bacterium]